MRNIYLLGVLVLGAGCTDLVPAPLPAGAVALEPPAVYRAAWDSVATCAGRSGDLARVQWFQVAGAAFSSSDGLTPGEWLAPHRIVVASDQVANPSNAYLVPRHEMLHDLLGGDAAHADAAWRRCGLLP